MLYARKEGAFLRKPTINIGHVIGKKDKQTVVVSRERQVQVILSSSVAETMGRLHQENVQQIFIVVLGKRDFRRALKASLVREGWVAIGEGHLTIAQVRILANVLISVMPPTQNDSMEGITAYILDSPTWDVTEGGSSSVTGSMAKV